ncbi:hypothetical protein GCM10009837_35970 [Streptomyces durmitorensis]|uniref:Secreted protein n=1 Tax=Streptomyces durmitorensis TaxID=319947 RepID=A0ABY4PVM1_9ACTN|nr:hypothetical protein [Streptomyces durmitorensis]UQT57611.1 hypothetical protein M4V62_22285 [Streptomyces durmitorensis]
MRRGIRNVLGASTAALCLGGLLAACGSGDGDGYVATGPAAAGPQRTPGAGVAPTGDVELVPLDRDEKSPGGKSGTEGEASGSEPSEPGSDASDGKSPDGKAGSGSADTPSGGDSSTDGAKPGRTEGSSGGSSGGSPEGTPSAPGGSSSAPPTGPAKLSVGEPQRKPADDRWCEKVTVSFKNTGGSPVRSGTVTFGTHVIGALGVDWATLDSTEKLPALDAGQRLTKTWPVCVDPWRVPLGMHVETRDVSVKWE